MSEPYVTKQITIAASPSHVWQALTDPATMPKWMSETEMNVSTDWTVGSSIIIQGRWHKMRYKNIGTVLRFDHDHFLSYSHLSSLSRLPDVPENHSVLTFNLEPQGIGTLLTLTLSNSPTYEIHKHLDFYWNVTLEELRRFVEQQLQG